VSVAFVIVVIGRVTRRVGKKPVANETTVFCSLLLWDYVAVFLPAPLPDGPEPLTPSGTLQHACMTDRFPKILGGISLFVSVTRKQILRLPTGRNRHIPPPTLPNTFGVGV